MRIIPDSDQSCYYTLSSRHTGSPVRVFHCCKKKNTILCLILCLYHFYSAAIPLMTVEVLLIYAGMEESVGKLPLL